jgi:hypothetical protein
MLAGRNRLQPFIGGERFSMENMNVLEAAAEWPDMPTIEQWARAQGFAAAAQVYTGVVGEVHAVDIEQLALRWAKIIEMGEA